MEYVAKPGNDAYATIRGFVFQVNLTIRRWLDLQNNQRLELECGEDIDLISQELAPAKPVAGRRLEQLKVRTTNLTLRSSEALQAVARFCEHRERNQAWELSFCYVTTSDLGVENNPWKGSTSAIAMWEAVRQQDGGMDEAAVCHLIGNFLRVCPQPSSVADAAWKCLQDVVGSPDSQLLLDIIRRFEWSVGHGDYLQIKAGILGELQAKGLARSSEEADRQFEHLFTYAFMLLCQPRKKTLSAAGLTTELNSPTIKPADTAFVLEVQTQLDLMEKRLSKVEDDLREQGGDVKVLKENVEALNTAFSLTDSLERTLLVDPTSSPDLARFSSGPRGVINEILSKLTDITATQREFRIIQQNLATLSQNFGLDPSFALGVLSISTEPPELVSPSLSRKVLVGGVIRRLQSSPIVVLRGEVGSGKTQLLNLVRTERHGKTVWLNIPRSSDEARARASIDLLLTSVANVGKGAGSNVWLAAIAEAFRGSLLVIDDLPKVLPGSELAIRLEVLAKAFKTVDAQLLCSTYYSLPSSFEQFGSIDINAPRFSKDDVAELFALLGAPAHLTTEPILDLIVTLSEGLPVMVVAAARHLADRSWNFSAENLESLLKGEFAKGIRADANHLLQAMVPDVEERELLIRLSLIIGPFSLKDVARIARVPRPITLPGEKVQRATGIWLQPLGSGRFLRSPLITANLGESLDPTTFRGVHHILGRTILRRKVLEPLEVLTCVNHFTLSEDTNFAYLVMIRALTELISHVEPMDNGLGLTKLLISAPLPPGAAIDLQLYLKVLQVVVADRLGGPIDLLIKQLDALMESVESKGWGVGMAAGLIAIRMARKNAALANRFLIPAIRGFAAMQAPNGMQMPHSEYPLEGILWMTAHSSRSDEDVYSWLDAVSQFTPAELETLKASDLAEDNITILCDGVWRRQYDKPESERDWTHAKEVLARIEQVGQTIPFPLLEAAAIRNRIVIRAEWENNVDDALSLVTAAVNRLHEDDCTFLVAEVIGRQLYYAGRSGEGAIWLERALACDAYQQSLWRRNVLITLAEIYGVSDSSRAVNLTLKAVDLCRDAGIMSSALVEALAEHAIAQWKDNQRGNAFRSLEEAVSKVLEIQSDEDSWKSLFYRVFAVTAYFSGVALNDKPQSGHTEPMQGLFLSSNSEASTAYRPAQLAYIGVRMAMYAEGIGDFESASRWSHRALTAAEIDRETLPVVRHSQWMGLAASLVHNDFHEAARIAIGMGTIELPTLDHVESLGQAARPLEKTRELLEANLMSLRTSSMLLLPVTSAALRLAFLRLGGTDFAVIDSAIRELEAIPAAHPSPEPYISALRTALSETVGWTDLRQLSSDSAKRAEYLCMFIYMIGTILRAPLPQSLYSQIWLVRELEKGFRSYPSIIREVVAPFLICFWEQAIIRSGFEFRTRESYTRERIDCTDKSFTGLRNLLEAMRFCLGTSLPADAMKWLKGE